MTKSRGLRVAKGTRPKWVAENQGKHFCRCGCGGAIPLKPEHYPHVPQFLHGHNAKVDPPRKPVFRPVLACACGCGELTAPGKQFRSGHNNRGQKRSEATRVKLREQKLGERNPNYGKLGEQSDSWKGGVQRSTNGYLLEYRPDHPYARKRYVMAHRLIAEAHLRETNPASPFLHEVAGELYLRTNVDVHHDNEVKDDNRLENLVVMWKADHTRHHNAARLAAQKGT